MENSQNYEEIKSKVDVNSLIDFVSIQEFGCNVSWGHNEDMWKVAGSKWKWLVTDFDRCFNYSSRYNDVSTDNLNEGGGGLAAVLLNRIHYSAIYWITKSLKTILYSVSQLTLTALSLRQE
jgi:hypothetical protein